MDMENFDNFSFERIDRSAKEVSQVIDNWAKMMELSDKQLLKQSRVGANMFNDRKIDKLDPAKDINFWVKYGVRYWQDLDGEVLGKTLRAVRSRERIKISSVLAKEAIKKINTGEKVNNLSKAEQISMLALTKAKLIVAEKMALDVYPALRNEFEASKKEVDKGLTDLLIDKERMVDISGNFDWNRVIPSGKAAVPMVFTIASLVISACGEVARAKALGGETPIGTIPSETTSVSDVSEPLTLSPEERESQNYLFDTKYGNEIYVYNEPWIQEKLADFKEKYGISIVNPWVIEDLNTGEKAFNLSWSPQEIEVLIDEVSKIPPEYLDQKYRQLPKSIVLIKVKNSSGSAGGYSLGTDLAFFIPSDFDLNKQMEGDFGLIFGTSEQFLRSAIDHEWTHNYETNNPEFVSGWVFEMGWTQDDKGNWSNAMPDEFVRLIDPSSQTLPREDMATSVQIFRFDPTRLSPARRNFIIKYFPDWQPVIDYLNN